MPNDDGQIHVQEIPGRVTFRVIGRVTMRQSPLFWERAAGALQTGMAVGIDLCPCTYMDSTFLGTLLRLSRVPEAKAGASTFALIAPSASCKGLLTQMGIDRAIPVVDANPGIDPADSSTSEEAAPWQAMDFGLSEAAVIQETVVHAHQLLAEGSGPGSGQFKAIAAKLAKAWEAEKSKKP